MWRGSKWRRQNGWWILRKSRFLKSQTTWAIPLKAIFKGYLKTVPASHPAPTEGKKHKAAPGKGFSVGWLSLSKKKLLVNPEFLQNMEFLHSHPLVEIPKPRYSSNRWHQYLHVEKRQTARYRSEERYHMVVWIRCFRYENKANFRQFYLYLHLRRKHSVPNDGRRQHPHFYLWF